MINLDFRKKMADSWFSYLQTQICKEFENLEKGNVKFKKRIWKKQIDKEGGGTSFLLTNGNIFEKVGVNKSTVSGKFKKNFRSKILGAKRDGKYWASGVSVVAHMKNPKIPAIHFNSRFIVTTKEWFGGGMDVTPSKIDKLEKKEFHKILKKMCDRHNKNYYKKYKKWCDQYFYLPHRNEARGIGGIFFDYKKKNFYKDFEFVRDVGVTFQLIFQNIILKKIKKKWTAKDKEIQFLKRGRYVEFNLLYDRGTKFGLQTGGNVEGILMSLPPLAKWK